MHNHAEGWLKGQLSDVTPEWDRLSALRSELAQLVLNKNDTMEARPYRDKLAVLQQRIDENERRLAGESASFKKELQQRIMTMADLSNTLPKNAAFVEQ
jgi:hypothetical protein